MISGVIIGVVKDNVDPEKLNRILVELPTESTEGSTETYWCRMTTPMAGKDRGWVCIPEIGTEVVLTFAYRSLQPYIIGAVYNGGEDKPEPYKNDDEKMLIRSITGNRLKVKRGVYTSLIKPHDINVPINVINVQDDVQVIEGDDFGFGDRTVKICFSSK